MAALPPGQKARPDQPPFGLPWYAHRMPRSDGPLRIEVGGDVEAPFELTAERLAGLERVDQLSDIHCATMWSRRDVPWGGYRFATVFEELLKPRVSPWKRITHVRFKGADGYRDVLPIEYLLADDVLLADHKDGAPLTIAHGAPLRLVAPQHYGYKSIKYLVGIDLLAGYRQWAVMTLHHPLARVAYEERTKRMGKRSAGLLTRWTMRRATMAMFARAAHRREPS